MLIHRTHCESLGAWVSHDTGKKICAPFSSPWIVAILTANSCLFVFYPFWSLWRFVLSLLFSPLFALLTLFFSLFCPLFLIGNGVKTQTPHICRLTDLRPLFFAVTVVVTVREKGSAFLLFPLPVCPWRRKNTQHLGLISTVAVVERVRRKLLPLDY